MECTEAERRLISLTERAFGKHLTTFLLGCSNGKGPSLTLSYVAYFTEGGEEKTTYLRVVAEDTSGLPEYKQSLVLIALLQLLLNSGADSNSKAAYTYEAVAELLGLDNTENMHAEIEQSIIKYFNLSYERGAICGVDGGDPSAEPNLKKRLIVEYEFSEEFVGAGLPPERSSNVVSFNPCFVEGLKNRTLLGISWVGVLSLRVTE